MVTITIQRNNLLQLLYEATRQQTGIIRLPNSRKT